MSTALGGGLFKARIARPGGGKSGGYRTIHFFRGEETPVFLLVVYAKSDKGALTQQEQNDLAQYAEHIGKTYEVAMSEVSDSVMRGLKEAEAFMKGGDVPGLVVHHPPSSIDVAAIRAGTGLSQERFAQSIGVSPKTLRNWEQGRRAPQGPARVLLALVERRPSVVQELLGA